MRLTVIWDREKRDFDLDADTLHGALQKCGVLFSQPCGGRGICRGCEALVSGDGEDFKKSLVCKTMFDRDMTVVLPARGVKVSWQDEEPGKNGSVEAHEGTGEEPRGKAGDGLIENTIPDIDTGQKSDLGLAVDIGSTTIGMAFCSRDDLGVAAFALYENPQRRFGADVISRIKAAGAGEKEELQRSVRKAIFSPIPDIAKGLGHVGSKPSKLVIAGNTTMIHLLMGEDVASLGSYPFDPGDISLRHITLEGMDAYIIPGISAFVGGDIVSGMYATGMDRDEGKTTLLIDLGTNGEMVIGNGRDFLATSTAAGPAFEAVGISCGMAGITGAISDIKLQSLGSSGRVAVSRTVIRDERGVMPGPVGVCGSGLVSAVSELVRLGLLDKTGAYTTEKLRRSGFTLYMGSGYEKNIVLTQDDIRTFLVAKAAVSAGIRILLDRWMSEDGHRPPDEVFLAGGFGDGLDLGAAIGIGLIPAEWKDITKPMGNTSLWGAEKLLRSLMRGDDKGLGRLRAMAAKTQVINLAEEEDFNSIYLEEMRYE